MGKAEDRGHGQSTVGITGEGVAGEKVDWGGLGNSLGCVGKQDVPG